MADPKQKLAGSEKFVTDVEFAQRAAGKAFLISSIVDGKFFRIAQHLYPTSEDSDAERMERRNGRGVIYFLFAAVGFGFSRFGFPLSVETTDHLAKPFFHLVGSFVGERHAENSLARNSRFDELGNAERNHSCLARASAGQNQHWPRERVDGIELIWVEATHGRTGFAFGFGDLPVVARRF